MTWLLGAAVAVLGYMGLAAIDEPIGALYMALYLVTGFALADRINPTTHTTNQENYCG